MEVGQVNLSVCIPLHDPNETNKAFFKHAIASILRQTKLPKEIVLSSNHPISYLDDVLKTVPQGVQTIILVVPTSGASQNFNNCINAATGKYIKLLCQDDFILNSKYFEDAVKSLEVSGRKWLASRCIHFDDTKSILTRRIKPRYRSRIIRGINTIGSPSVIIFDRSSFVPFSDNLDYMYDCEWYVRMFHNFGKPIIKRNYDIAIRIHSNQSTNTVSDLLPTEIILASQMHYDKKLMSKSSCSCVVKINVHE